jgi:acetolactate synthase-1/2/3 large subunit
VILLGGRALRERGLRAAASIAEATGATLLAETFPARQERGGGLPPIERLAYLGEMASASSPQHDTWSWSTTPAPVSFFAYPGQPSELWPKGCELHVLAGPEHDVIGALEALAVPFDRPGHPKWAPSRATTIAPSSDRLTHLGEPGGAIAYVLPEGAVVVDESNTAGSSCPVPPRGSPRHDWLCNTGGAIGLGLPVATGAAIGAPDRP